MDREQFFQEYKLQIIAAGLGTFLLGIGIFSAVFLGLKNSADSDIEILSSQEEEKKEILVHVAGAVEKPGLYHLDVDARVNDVLIAAGGLSAEADRDWFEKTVNLAEKIKDGVKLYIPSQGENIAAADSKSAEVAGEQTSIFADSQGKISLNNASLDELDNLPGIGPAYAQKIIDNRPFKNIEEVKNISGIGETAFEKIKEMICL